MSIGMRVAVVAAAWALLRSTAWAGDILDRVQRDGVVHCAAVERPGYAEIENDKPIGRAADLCGKVAARVLGPGGRYALRLLDLDSDYDRVRRGEIDLAFLEPRTVAEQHLSVELLPAGEAYSDHFAVLLRLSAAARELSDLHGQTICFMIGDPVWPLLSGNLASRHVAFRPFGFSEEVEMKDAYNVGRCVAVAGLASGLDEIRQDHGVKHLQSRLLDENLGADPVDAMVPAGDSEWRDAVRQAFGRPTRQR